LVSTEFVSQDKLQKQMENLNPHKYDGHKGLSNIQHDLADNWFKKFTEELTPITPIEELTINSSDEEAPTLSKLEKKSKKKKSKKKSKKLKEKKLKEKRYKPKYAAAWSKIGLINKLVKKVQSLKDLGAEDTFTDR